MLLSINLVFSQMSLSQTLQDLYHQSTFSYNGLYHKWVHFKSLGESACMYDDNNGWCLSRTFYISDTKFCWYVKAIKNLQQPYKVSTVIVHTSQLRKSRCREWLKNSPKAMQWVGSRCREKPCTGSSLGSSLYTHCGP